MKELSDFHFDSQQEYENIENVFVDVFGHALAFIPEHLSEVFKSYNIACDVMNRYDGGIFIIGIYNDGIYADGVCMWRLENYTVDKGIWIVELERCNYNKVRVYKTSLGEIIRNNDYYDFLEFLKNNL